MSLDLPSFSPCDALVAVMVAVSASGKGLGTAEMVAIERLVNHTPVFATYDIGRLRPVSQTILTIFEDEEGLDALFGLVRDALPEKLFETAYVLACDVATADGQVGQDELRMLTELRDELDIDRLHAAAIELAARARNRRI
ncbi:MULTISPECIES: tellurite resistance TerB family protein [unclassified Paracoccus (in: a-proteobacteria)]|uniref:tellurite resistance TerB family protein n=1 Tax=unclassified Paracoccus (in: a-proteobacteria) TaxID=2688777 RepID=UPI0016037E9E|nr:MULTISPECIES: tellurite resistance TerB family protein [unclassified Paracoccus (in: a-proteobacteria)]MBB1491775.1 tellurite resistance TerB family protein [Paracoccus sp. MC1854]MBB1496870.1 tellurite resistance TerB family protein [Paracoccus sp. MC1862]QQO46308.1 tellurite resistance TerB family protein [Paracoccus sp. MC1862]